MNTTTPQHKHPPSLRSSLLALADKWDALAKQHGVRTFTGNDHALFANELRSALAHKTISGCHPLPPDHSVDANKMVAADNAQGLRDIIGDLRNSARHDDYEPPQIAFIESIAGRLEALATHPPQQERDPRAARGLIAQMVLDLPVMPYDQDDARDIAKAILALSIDSEPAAPAAPAAPATPESAEPVAMPAYWLAVDPETGSVEIGMSTDDTNNGEFARAEVNRFINEHGACMQLVAAYSRPATAPDSSAPTPAGLDKCPITGLPFFENIEHPDLGMVPTYGGPFDSYTIPMQEEDGDLRRERYDHDRDEWIEGGEHFASIANETGANPTPAASDGGLREALKPLADVEIFDTDGDDCTVAWLQGPKVGRFTVAQVRAARAALATQPAEQAKPSEPEVRSASMYGLTRIAAELAEQQISDSDMDAAAASFMASHEESEPVAAPAQVTVPRAMLEQIYGMAREGCDSPTVAYRWCERIDELFHVAAASDEYVEFAQTLPAALADQQKGGGR